MKFTGSDKYYLDPELEAIVNMAIKMEKPLLLTGEPGTGKTQLAFEISRSLGIGIEILRAKSTIKGEEACYVQDTVLRLNDARFGTEETDRNVNDFFDYVIWGPIGRAFRSEDRVVLLLDEIDKTESDVQDNLLDVLEENQFVIREVNKVIGARQPPIILITSNAKRELSDPFLRRCFCHHIAFPSPEDMREIVKLHFPEMKATLLEPALNMFYELRERGYEKPPATSELLNWLGAMIHAGVTPDQSEDLPFPGVLLKRTNDILSYRGKGKSERKKRSWSGF
ncbi:MoxR family ATPase [Sulfidibacter corallicola]|uniref:MoxR family ATPase n=1 Tax=Sulfidibacter corallicola TaxID=2818388 RepID=A0A8A4TNE3_SULCO|nr:MoxR family ATPase [Sulfidibacter corallicola]QTD51486.1 MoxR family ATPase [Sulfidibacter corallicola]